LTSAGGEHPGKPLRQFALLQCAMPVEAGVGCQLTNAKGEQFRNRPCLLKELAIYVRKGGTGVLAIVPGPFIILTVIRWIATGRRRFGPRR